MAISGHQTTKRCKKKNLQLYSEFQLNIGTMYEVYIKSIHQWLVFEIKKTTKKKDVSWIYNLNLNWNIKFDCVFFCFATPYRSSYKVLEKLQSCLGGTFKIVFRIRINLLTLQRDSSIYYLVLNWNISFIWVHNICPGQEYYFFYCKYIRFRCKKSILKR